jgi:3-hydroxyisobutyrate dehydrogenase-like beta-hydroxyacid dehydrogenase
MSSDATLGPVSVLGTGAIGSRVAAVLAASGRRVTAWNRTAGRAHALAGRGVLPVASVADAAAASPLVIVCLTDYAAVHDVLEAASSALAGRTVVSLTTGAPEEARSAADLARRAGARYVDGGVQTAPEAIGTPAATFVYGGPRPAFDEHRAALETIGSASYLGPDPGAAAVQDLALFGLWYDAQIGLLRALETVRAAGIDVEAFASRAATQLAHVVQAAGQTAHEVAARSYPRGPADLTEHAPVLERLRELRRDQRLGDGDLERIEALVRRRIAAGHGREGLTGIVEGPRQ